MTEENPAACNPTRSTEPSFQSPSSRRKNLRTLNFPAGCKRSSTEWHRPEWESKSSPKSDPHSPQSQPTACPDFPLDHQNSAFPEQCERRRASVIKLP